MAKITLNRVNEFITRHKIRCNEFNSFSDEILSWFCIGFPSVYFLFLPILRIEATIKKVYLD